MSFLLTAPNIAEVRKRIDDWIAREGRDEVRLLMLECNRFISDYVRGELLKKGFTEDDLAILEQMFERGAKREVFGD